MIWMIAVMTAKSITLFDLEFLPKFISMPTIKRRKAIPASDKDIIVGEGLIKWRTGPAMMPAIIKKGVIGCLKRRTTKAAAVANKNKKLISIKILFIFCFSCLLFLAPLCYSNYIIS